MKLVSAHQLDEIRNGLYEGVECDEPNDYLHRNRCKSSNGCETVGERGGELSDGPNLPH